MTHKSHKLEYKVDLNRTDRDNALNYAHYALVNDDGSLICAMYGGASAMLMEILCKALDTMNPQDYPSSRDIFDRHNKQEGIVWKAYRVKGEFGAEFVQFKDGKMVECPHWFRDDVEYIIEDVK